MDMFTSYGYIKNENKNTDFLKILAWLCVALNILEIRYDIKQ